MKITTLFLSLLLATAACSQGLPGDNPPIPPEAFPAIQYFKQHSALNWKKFDSLREAAIYGAQRLEQCSQYYECSGFIVTNKDGKFLMSPVRTDYASDHVHVTERNPTETKRVADIHSHPCVPEHVTNKFSPEDMIGAITSRTTAYIVDLCTGDVHEFLPGVTKPDEEYDEDAEIWMSGGTVIGHVLKFKQNEADVGL